jgi:hypothetical protein
MKCWKIDMSSMTRNKWINMTLYPTIFLSIVMVLLLNTWNMLGDRGSVLIHVHPMTLSQVQIVMTKHIQKLIEPILA